MRDNVIAAAAEIEAAFEWITGVHIAADPNTLADPGRFPSLDMKLSIAVTEAARSNTELFKEILLTKETLAKEKKLFRGRQILLLVMQRYRTSTTQGHIFEFRG